MKFSKYTILDTHSVFAPYTTSNWCVPASHLPLSTQQVNAFSPPTPGELSILPALQFLPSGQAEPAVSKHTALHVTANKQQLPVPGGGWGSRQHRGGGGEAQMAPCHPCKPRLSNRKWCCVQLQWQLSRSTMSICSHKPWSLHHEAACAGSPHSVLVGWWMSPQAASLESASFPQKWNPCRSPSSNPSQVLCPRGFLCASWWGWRTHRWRAVLVSLQHLLLLFSFFSTKCPINKRKTEANHEIQKLWFIEMFLLAWQILAHVGPLCIVFGKRLWYMVLLIIFSLRDYKLVLYCLQL